MRQDYAKFVERNAEILVLGPDGPNAFKRYWAENEMPFIGMADIRSKIAGQYGQQVNWLKLGRMPAIMVIDPQSATRYEHFGDSMADIPTTEQVLAVLDEINRG